MNISKDIINNNPIKLDKIISFIFCSILNGVAFVDVVIGDTLGETSNKN